MSLRGTTVLEEVTASIVVIFIYPGSISDSPCDCLQCRAQMRKGRTSGENTEV